MLPRQPKETSLVLSVPPNVSDDPSSSYDESVIPNIAPSATEHQHFSREVAERIQCIRIPPITTQLISETQRSCIISLGFPTIFPRAQAEFNLPRERSITYLEWVRHLMKYRDGRFARRHRLHCYLFNTLIRRQSQSISRFYINND